MRSKLILLALAVVALVGAQAKADFVYTINGLGPNGTHQSWDAFANAGAPVGNAILDIAADQDGNPYGTPLASIFAELGPGDTSGLFGPVVSGGTVYATPQMQIVLNIPNLINPALTKVVQATLVYQTQQTAGSGFVSAFLVNPGQSALDPITAEETTVGDWTTLLLEWTYPQLYDREQITVVLHDSGVTLDSIVVSTQCVPVPGAVLLGMLGLGYAGRKLRRFV